MNWACRARVLLACTILLPAGTAAKCPWARVVVSGEILGGSPEKQQVQVEVSFPEQPERPSVVLADGKFSATLEFSTYKSFNWLTGDNCSRRPQFITVLLLHDGYFADSLQLDFKRDFISEDPYSYKPRSKLTLRVDLTRCSPAPVEEQKLDFEGVDFTGYRRAPLTFFAVLPDGSVDKVRLKRRSGSRDLDRRILNSVRNWRFNARPGCLVVEEWMDVLINLR